MYCRNCGHQVADKYRYCTYCGSPMAQFPKRNSSQMGQGHTSEEMPCIGENPPRQHKPNTSNSYSQKSYNAEKKAPAKDGSLAQEEGKRTAGETVYALLALLWGAGKALVVIIGIIGVLWVTLDPYHNVLGIRTMRKAYRYAQEAIVEQYDIASSEFDFPKFDLDFIRRGGETTVEGVECRKYIFNSYFHAPNLFGVEMRYDYEIEIYIPISSDLKGYYYEIIDLE